MALVHFVEFFEIFLHSLYNFLSLDIQYLIFCTGVLAYSKNYFFHLQLDTHFRIFS